MNIPRGGQDVTQEEVQRLAEERSRIFLESGADSLEYQEIDEQLEQARQLLDEQQLAQAQTEEEAERIADRIERERIRREVEADEDEEDTERIVQERIQEEVVQAPPPEPQGPADQPVILPPDVDTSGETVVLSTGEEVGTEQYVGLSEQEQRDLFDLGVDTFNQRQQELFEEAQRQRQAATERLEDFGGIVDAIAGAQTVDVEGEDELTVAEVRTLALQAGYTPEQIDELLAFRGDRIRLASRVAQFNRQRLGVLRREEALEDLSGFETEEGQYDLAGALDAGALSETEARQLFGADAVDEAVSFNRAAALRGEVLVGLGEPETEGEYNLTEAILQGTDPERLEAAFDPEAVREAEENARAARELADQGIIVSPTLIPEGTRITLLERRAELMEEIDEFEDRAARVAPGRIGLQGRRLLQAQIDRRREDVGTIDTFLTEGGVIPDVRVERAFGEVAQAQDLVESRREIYQAAQSQFGEDDPFTQARLNELRFAERQVEAARQGTREAAESAGEDLVSRLVTGSEAGAFIREAQLEPGSTAERVGRRVAEEVALGTAFGVAGSAALRAGTAAVRATGPALRRGARATGQLLREERGLITAVRTPAERTAFDDILRQAEEITRTPNRYRSEADFEALRRSLSNRAEETARFGPRYEPRAVVGLTDDQVEQIVTATRSGSQETVAATLASIRASNEALVAPSESIDTAGPAALEQPRGFTPLGAPAVDAAPQAVTADAPQVAGLQQPQPVVRVEPGRVEEGGGDPDLFEIISGRTQTQTQPQTEPEVTTRRTTTTTTDQGGGDPTIQRDPQRRTQRTPATQPEPRPVTGTAPRTTPTDEPLTTPVITTQIDPASRTEFDPIRGVAPRLEGITPPRSPDPTGLDRPVPIRGLPRPRRPRKPPEKEKQKIEELEGDYWEWDRGFIRVRKSKITGRETYERITPETKRVKGGKGKAKRSFRSVGRQTDRKGVDVHGITTTIVDGGITHRRTKKR